MASFTSPPTNGSQGSFLSGAESDSLNHLHQIPLHVSILQTALWFLADEDDDARRWSSFIGIVIAISGNILISLALNIQKYAHVRLEREERRQQLELRRRQSRENHGRSTSQSTQDSSDVDVRKQPSKLSGLNTQQKYLRSRLWWSGLILMCIGECGNFLAYGFAPASIVSPLGVVALISNCIIAPLLLKEPFRKRDYLGVLVSIAGAVVVVSSSAPEEKKLGPDELFAAISQTAFKIYFAVVCAITGVLLYLSKKWGRKNIFIDLGLVALFGGFTALSTKAISSLLSSSLYHIFTMPIAYLFAFVLVLTAVLQIKYLNRSLQNFDSTQVIPTQFVLFTLSVIIGSSVLYRDFERVDKRRFVRFIIGCGLTFSGVYMISSGRSHHDIPLDQDDAGGLGTEESGVVPNGESTVLGEEPSESSALLADHDGDDRHSVDSDDTTRALLIETTPQQLERFSTGGTAVVSVEETSLPESLQRASLALVPPIVVGFQLQAVAGDVGAQSRSRRSSIKRQVANQVPAILDDAAANNGNAVHSNGSSQPLQSQEVAEQDDSEEERNAKQESGLSKIVGFLNGGDKN